MKVKTLLNKFTLHSVYSSIELVRIERNNYTVKEYNEYDLPTRDYGFYGDETVKAFSVHGKDLVIYI